MRHAPHPPFFRPVATALSLWLASTAGTAARADAIVAADARPARVTVFWENDGGYYKPNHGTDRHYTNGTGIAVSLQPRWVDDLAAGLGLPADGTAAGLALTQQIFTPDDIEERVPDPDDRPYAGYLFVSGFLQRQTGNHLDHLRLDLGVVGPSSLAEPIQEWVHDFTNADDPTGWDAQLGDEFAAQLTYRRRYRYDLPDLTLFNRNLASQLIPYGELRLGSVYRSVGLGLGARIGVNLPDDFGPSHLTDLGAFTAPPDPDAPRWSGYLYGRALGRYHEWNTFIEGSNRRDPSPSVSLVPFTGEVQAGLAIARRLGDTGRFEFNYSQVFMTESFREQDAADSYASFALTLRFTF